MIQSALITGAGGYVGTTLVPILLAAGHKVTAIDTFWFGRDFLPRHPNLVCVKEDTRRLSAEHFRGIDFVIDLAALSNDPCGEAFTQKTWDINHRARAKTAKLAKQAGVSRYLLASSCSVYGFSDIVQDEYSVPRPLTAYAKANLAVEEDTLSLASPSFSVTALRLATLYGSSPRMRLDLVVNSMCHSAWLNREVVVNGAGSQVRPLLHVEDAAKAFCQFSQAKTEAVNRQIFNIGSDEQNLPVNDIGKLIIQACDNLEMPSVKAVHAGPQDLRSYRVDFQKVRRLGIWEPKKTIIEAAEEILHDLLTQRLSPSLRCYTLDWYKEIWPLPA